MTITLKQAAARLKTADKILITAHVQPDGDAIGSTLSAMLILRSLGKTAQIFIDDTVRKNLHALPHFEEIRRPVADEKFDADLLLILDTSADRIGNVRKLTTAPALNIDHHVTNDGTDVDELFVDSNAAATCEIVYKLAAELDATITPEIATCLYTGLATDTGFFQFSNTRADTLAVASELIRCGVSPHFISEQLESKSLAEVRGLATALNSLKMYFGNKVAGMTIDLASAATFESTEGFIDEIRVIETVDVAFLITEKAQNFCRVSMRSKGVDVSKVAASLGGGGHVRAAGCTLKMPLADAEKILVDAIGKAL